MDSDGIGGTVRSRVRECLERRPETKVKGMQEGAGVAAAVKHFAFNDQAQPVMDID